MNAILTKTIAFIVAGVIIFGMGMGTMWKLSHQSPAMVMQKAAPAYTQKDGSQVLQVAPDPKAKPDQEMPKGSTLLRKINLKIQSKSGVVTAPINAEGQPMAQISPTPMTLSLDLVKLKDGSERAIASSTDGTILGGVDIPVAPSISVNHPYAAGLSYEPFTKAYGAWISRDIGRLVVGADLYQVKNLNQSTWAASFRVGYRF